MCVGFLFDVLQGFLWVFKEERLLETEAKLKAVSAVHFSSLLADVRVSRLAAEGEYVECADPCSWLTAGSASRPACCWDISTRCAAGIRTPFGTSGLDTGKQLRSLSKEFLP